MKPTQVLEKLYRLKEYGRVVWDIAVPGFPDEGVGEQGDGELVGLEDKEGSEQVALEYEAHDDVVPACYGPSHTLASVPYTSEKYLLSIKREYLTCSLAPRSTYAGSLAGIIDRKILQILKVVKRDWAVVSPFKTRYMQTPVWQAWVQEYTVWGDRQGVGADIYPDGDGYLLDIGALTPWRNIENAFNVLSLAVSDLQGCMSIMDSQPLVHSMPLDCASAPVLLILKELARQGWAPCDAHLTHVQY